MRPIFFDAHNHLQDQRLASSLESIIAAYQRQNVAKVVVNGSHPSDWDVVARLARSYDYVVPSFGVHPWYINDLPSDWLTELSGYLDAFPCAIGEIGIDGWRKGFDLGLQEEIFVGQLKLAAERNLPASIHGLKRWGRLLELLKKNPRPERGFLLHSYGGSAGMIPAFVDLGAYFSCPGAYLKRGRERKLAVFKSVPLDRLLVETDAPDQNLPDELDTFDLSDPLTGSHLNHPLNIITVTQRVADALEIPLSEFSVIIEANFKALFGVGA
jgi:TatD DNase family protein